MNRKKEMMLDKLKNLDKIRKAQKFIETNWDTKFGLIETAKEVCLSPKYLSRLFKQRTGMNFNKYKLTIKMNKAKHLLDEGACSVNHISDKMGYMNPESFIRIFRKYFGCTPAAYRRTGYSKKINIAGFLSRKKGSGKVIP